MAKIEGLKDIYICPVASAGVPRMIIWGLMLACHVLPTG